MSIAKTIEVIASSDQGIEAAIRNGITKVSETISGIEGAWVKDTKVVIRDAAIAEWRVTLVVTFIVH